MPAFLKRACAIGALLVLSSTWAAGWSVAFHVARDHHHDDATAEHAGALGLEMILHGHGHGDETPAHEHPLVPSIVVPVLQKVLVFTAVMIGDVPEVAGTGIAGWRLVSAGGPTHDPPPRLEAVSVLRI